MVYPLSNGHMAGTSVAASEVTFSRGAVLDGFNPSIFARDCPAARISSLANGALIYHQGSRCDFVYCVLQGQAKLARVNQDGDELTTHLLSTGELFGPALGLSDSAEAQETAVGRGPTSLWQAPVVQFRQLLRNQPAVALHVIEALSRRQRQMERRLECFAFKRAEARLAETLRELSGGFETRCEHGFGRHIRLTQQELADLVGASRPVISTILNRLRKAGVLGYNREYLCVRGLADIERLIEC